jgi:hypothetical protein
MRLHLHPRKYNNLLPMCRVVMMTMTKRMTRKTKLQFGALQAIQLLLPLPRPRL